MGGTVVFLLTISVFSKTVSEVWAFEDSEDLIRNSKETANNANDDLLNLEKGGPFWRKSSDTRSESDHRSFHSDPSELNLSNKQEDLTKLTLRDFLQLYAKKQSKKPVSSDDNDDPRPQYLDTIIQDEQDRVNSKDKSKSWTLVDVQKHKHPFEDKKGWVSLDPIPWSISKISKWQSKYKPVNDRPWDEHGPISSERPYPDTEDEFNIKRPVSITPPSPYMYHPKPTESSDRYDNFYDHLDRPKPTPAPNSYPKPAAFYGHKVHVEAHYPSNSYSSTGKPYPYHNQKDCRHPNHPHDEIMTDGMTPNFPEPNPYETLRRRGTEMEIHPESHPLQGEGEWVLLSTTKGYKPPRNRPRSLDTGTANDATQSLRTMRGIRLTVLPPLKGSKINMTTSHGGLLQVESTFESVEQAKRKFDKRQTTLKIKGKRKRRKHVKKANNNKPDNDKVQNRPFAETQQAVATVPNRNTDPGAVMAAVGAGMIPATMAMMVPIAMSG